MSKHAWAVYNTETLALRKTWRQEVRAARDAQSAGKDYAILPEHDYQALIAGKTRTVKNLLSGADVEIPINTPRCCDPSTELYWSM